MSERRVVGPFPPYLVPNAHISCFGVIPKSHQPNKWRLIIDLSHPKGKSINDSIQKDLCSMSYISVDDAIRQIITLGHGTLLAKIKSTFRRLTVTCRAQFTLTPASPLVCVLPQSYLMSLLTSWNGFYSIKGSPSSCITLKIFDHRSAKNNRLSMQPALTHRGLTHAGNTLSNQKS